MGSTERLAAIERIYAAFNARDVRALAAEVTERFEWHPGPDEPEQKVWRGRETALTGVSERWAGLERLTTEVEELLEAGRFALASVRHTALPQGSEMEISRREHHLWSFDDQERIASLREFSDREEALRVTEETGER